MTTKCPCLFLRLSTGQPGYINALLEPYVPSRDLRSACNGLTLVIPWTNSVSSSYAFSVYGPRVWNSLPRSVRDLASNSLASADAFKTALFNAAFNTD